jgi:hypothetical protein
MTLQRLPLRTVLACLLVSACGNETSDESLDPEAVAGPYAPYEELALESRNAHCRHRGGCSDSDAGAPGSAGDAASSQAPDPGTALQTFTVTGVAGKGGSAVASSPTGTCTNAGVNWSCSVPAGGSVVVQALPADTWRLASWNCPTGVATGDTMTIANVQAAADCFASFRPITFSVAYEARDQTGALLSGLVTAYNASRGPCTDDVCLAQQGERVVLSAGATAGMTFVGWSGCADSKPSELSLVVTADQACVAHYERAAPPVLL